jgi:GNAT superfamily N-acetyltransferase
MKIVGPKLEIRSRCEEILRSLPNWFGIEDALVQYAEDTTRLPTFAALEGEHPQAFLTLRNHFPEAWELSCIAVDAMHRGRGYGSALLMHAEAWLLSQGARFLQVKTIAATSPDPYYAETRRFYERRAFVSLEVFPKVWDSSNPCLQMIKRLDDR